MITKPVWVMIVCAAVLTGASAGASAAPPTANRTPSGRLAKADEQAEVRRTLKLMRLWVQMQDFVPLDEFAYGENDEGRKFVAAVSEYSKAVHALIDPVRQRLTDKGVDMMRLKFPAEADAIAEMRGMGDRTYEMVDAVPVRITGDEATVGDPANKSQSRQLRRIDGRWKEAFDLQAFLTANGWEPSMIKTLTVGYTQMARDLDELRKEIAAGKYKTIEDAVAARRKIEQRLYPNW